MVRKENISEEASSPDLHEDLYSYVSFFICFIGPRSIMGENSNDKQTLVNCFKFFAGDINGNLRDAHQLGGLERLMFRANTSPDSV